MRQGTRASVSTASSAGSVKPTTSQTAQSPAKDAKKPAAKLPRMFTHQVLTGFLNDVFSSCTFVTRPPVDANVVNLAQGSPASPRRYMLVLRLGKKGLVYEIISHNFDPPSKGSKSAKPDKNLKAEQLAVGTANALRENFTQPTSLSQVPTAILKGHVDKSLNRGGLWAYMSLPSFIGGGATDETAVRERRERILVSAENGIPPISGDAIVSLLYVLHSLKAASFVRDVCVALCQEYLEHHTDLRSFVQVLYLGSAAGALSEALVTQQVNTRLNNIQVLEALNSEDLVLLLGCFSDRAALNLAALRKVLLILVEEVEVLGPNCVLCLASVLVKLDYRFHANSHFTNQLVYQLATSFDKIPMDAIILVCALGFVRCDFPHFDSILDSILLKFHLLDHQLLVLIGAAYAFSRRLMSDVDALHLEAPRSAHVYHCLEFYITTLLKNALVESEGMVGTLCYSSGSSVDVSPSAGGGSRARNTLRQGTRTPSAAAPAVAPAQPAASSMQPFGDFPTPSNSSKLFYLNLVEDCCIRYEELSFDSLSLLCFSLLTFHIDISPLHEAMMVAQGLLLRKSRNPVKLKETTTAEMEHQYDMCYAILQYAQAPTDGEAPLELGGLRSQCAPVAPEPSDDTVEPPSASEPVSETAPVDEAATPAVPPAPAATPPASPESSPTPPLTEVAAPAPKAQPAPPSAPAQNDFAPRVLESVTAALSGMTAEGNLTAENLLRVLQPILAAKAGVSAEAKAKTSAPPASPAKSPTLTARVPRAADVPSPLLKTRSKGSSATTSPLTKPRPAPARAPVPASHNATTSYQVMYAIRQLRYHRATLVKHRVYIKHSYVKAGKSMRH
ncbi:1-phosphatidylinositol 4,5-bisphosphate phosphodiesterase beta-2-like protein, putative [Babesia caballi]|uniref:1-phosphatidylinositol 4,5-bisphosphate phosphodiesterase beta-2-like protein, putative n=1 Tax=Babesia caballi TaxID=5871 RepID=A0AAV4LZ61_BABCB|nr:1-phosphatidylinositol 4,5-bisphosphate phosphodiesterase beta-2-like protein, putative [Babesia caballi]